VLTEPKNFSEEDEQLHSARLSIRYLKAYRVDLSMNLREGVTCWSRCRLELFYYYFWIKNLNLSLHLEKWKEINSDTNSLCCTESKAILRTVIQNQWFNSMKITINSVKRRGRVYTSRNHWKTTSDLRSQESRANALVRTWKGSIQREETQGKPSTSVLLYSENISSGGTLHSIRLSSRVLA
jgi:hypothetical protein